MSSDVSNILDDDLLGTPTTEQEALKESMSYKPSEEGELKASKILQDDPDYDTDKANTLTQESIRHQLANVKLPPLPVQLKPDYQAITARMDEENFYSVKNVGDIDLVIDWDMVLMPKDMQVDFKKYLEAKYIQNGMQQFIGKIILTAIYKNHRTIDFLQSFVNEKQIPTMLPRIVGNIVETKSQFVIPKGGSVIVTESQLESLRKFQKVKKKYTKAKNDGEMFTSWLGFLIFECLTKDTVEAVERSYASIADVYNSAVRLNVSELNKPKKMGLRHDATVIEATE